MCGGMRCARACNRSRRACVRRLRGNGVERCAKLTLDIESTIKHRVIMLAGGMVHTRVTTEERNRTLFAEQLTRSYTATTAITARVEEARRGAAGGGAQFLNCISEFFFAEIPLCDETPIPTTGRMSSAVAPAPAPAPASNRTHSRLARAVSRFPSTSSISQRVGSLSSVRRATS